MKIYKKPTEQDPKDIQLEDLLKEENLTLCDPAEEWLDRLLKESKVEYDELWMAKAESQMPEGMELRLKATIDDLEAQEVLNESQTAPVIKMARQDQTEPPKSRLKFWHKTAACIAVLLAIGIGYNIQGSNNAFADTCKTPEEAQLHLERALVLLSKNGKAIDKAEETLQQARTPQENGLAKYITIQ